MDSKMIQATNRLTEGISNIWKVHIFFLCKGWENSLDAESLWKQNKNNIIPICNFLTGEFTNALELGLWTFPIPIENENKVEQISYFLVFFQNKEHNHFQVIR